MNEEKTNPILRFINYLFIIMICFIFYSIGHLVGVFQSALDFNTVYDIEELKLKYNQSKEVIYINCIDNNSLVYSGPTRESTDINIFREIGKAIK